jgi:hypothetical protein
MKKPERVMQRVAKAVHIIIAMTLGVLAQGCADFMPYSGQKQNWPTQPGAFVNTRFAVPIYVDGYPSRPYNVIGTIYLNDTIVAISYAANRAKQLGADAVIALPKGYGGSYTSGSRLYDRQFLSRRF